MWALLPLVWQVIFYVGDDFVRVNFYRGLVACHASEYTSVNVVWKSVQCSVINNFIASLARHSTTVFQSGPESKKRFRILPRNSDQHCGKWSQCNATTRGRLQFKLFPIFYANAAATVFVMHRQAFSAYRLWIWLFRSSVDDVLLGQSLLSVEVCDYAFRFSHLQTRNLIVSFQQRWHFARPFFVIGWGLWW